MKDIKNQDYLHIEILEILGEIGTGIVPYNSNDEAYFPVLVKWRPITSVPRLIPIENDFSVDIVYIEEYIKSGIKLGVYKKIQSAAPSVAFAFRAETEKEAKLPKVA